MKVEVIDGRNKLYQQIFFWNRNTVFADGGRDLLLYQTKILSLFASHQGTAELQE
jgi:hypothetical protein